MSTLTMSRGSDSHMEKKLAPVDPALAIPIRLTNFSIQEILKPRFGIVATQRGVKRAELERDTEPHLSAFTAKVRRLSSEQDTDLPCFIGKSSKKDVIGDVQKRYSESSDSDSTHSNGLVWPAWVYCTRYSDRPSAGPRLRKTKRSPSGESSKSSPDEKRPRTAFSNEQLGRLRNEFDTNKYLTEDRRRRLASELSLNDYQVKIWFQNKRAKLKKSEARRNPLALELMAHGLYVHSTHDASRQNDDACSS